LMRVRHFGFLANNAKERLCKCRQLLGLLPALPKPPQRSAHELMLALTGIDLSRCPRCRKATLIFVPNYPSRHHRILRDGRSTIRPVYLRAALSPSQCASAPHCIN
jgi:hypothetical protein